MSQAMNKPFTTSFAKGNFADNIVKTVQKILL